MTMVTGVNSENTVYTVNWLWLHWRKGQRLKNAKK
jgi:hypothetical protein